jgi:hypothetical protein
MRVADIGHRHTRHSIQILTSRLIPKSSAQAFAETQGQGLVSGHQASGGHDIKLHQLSVFLQYG